MSVALTEKISESELAQRVAVIKRFKELLIQQRERFRSYLDVLDRQQLLIGYGNAEEISAHVELEEQIVSDIFSIQKVIAPLEIMYNAAPYLPANDVPELQATLEDLKNQAVARTEQNRDLLSCRMEKIDTEIQALQKNPVISKARYSLYQNAAPALVDVMG